MEETLRLFLSYTFDKDAQNVVDAFREVAKSSNYEVITGEPPDSKTPPEVVRSRIFSSDCFAALMTSKDKGTKTSGWISNEIGIAYALDMPLLICKEKLVADIGLATFATSYLNFEQNNLSAFKVALEPYLRNVRSDPRLRRNESLGSFINSLVRRSIEGWESTSQDDLRQKFTAALDKITSTIQEDKNLLRIYSNSEIVRDALTRLNSFEGLEPKLSIAKEKKQIMAHAFAQLHGDDITKYKEIFLESGSTVAEIARELSSTLPKTAGLHGKNTPRVMTNNALAYLYLWLCAGVMCEPAPEGPPDPRYGGMYGPLTGRSRKPDYKAPLSEYDPGGKNIVETMSLQLFGNTDKKKSLILAAASGLQLSNEINAVFPIEEGQMKSRMPERQYTDPAILNQLQNNCRGFHVGSYENHLFKRVLYSSEIPMIVFIHDSKIDCPIEVGRCHFMFDSDMPWDTFLKDRPLSIWVACDKSTCETIYKKASECLDKKAWITSVYAESTDFPIVISHNNIFRDASKEIGIQPYSRR